VALLHRKEPPHPDERSGRVLVEARKQLSNHLEEDIQLLINFESSLKFD
jgi:hypothetical protein